MTISCIIGLGTHVSSGLQPETSAVSAVRSAAFNLRDARALAPGHRVARSDFTGRRREKDLLEDGGLVAERRAPELPQRARTRPGAGRPDQRHADRARPGSLVPARGGGVPPPHDARPLGARVAIRACRPVVADGRAAEPRVLRGGAGKRRLAPEARRYTGRPLRAISSVG